MTLDGCEDFYEVVIQTITGLARQGLPISTRIMAILTKTKFGSQAAEGGPADQMLSLILNHRLVGLSLCRYVTKST